MAYDNLQGPCWNVHHTEEESFNHLHSFSWGRIFPQIIIYIPTLILTVTKGNNINSLKWSAIGRDFAVFFKLLRCWRAYTPKNWVMVFWNCFFFFPCKILWFILFLSLGKEVMQLLIVFFLALITKQLYQDEPFSLCNMWNYIVISKNTHRLFYVWPWKREDSQRCPTAEFLSPHFNVVGFSFFSFKIKVTKGYSTAFVLKIWPYSLIIFR